MKTYRFLFLFSIFILNLFADVQLQIPSTVVRGEPLIFSIEVSGSNIKFPNMSKIDGNVINEVSSSSSTNIINSQITKKIRKVYSFYPTKDFTLPSLEFEIDSKSFYTEEKKVKLTNPTKTKSDQFDLNIKANNTDVFVGENFILNLVFKYKRDTQIVDLAFEKPNFDNFWFKQLNDTKQYQEGEYVVQELNFLMFPLKVGKIKINPISIQAQIVDLNRNSFSMFSNPTKVLKIYSNELEFDVKALPQNVKLIGDFDINSTVDKLKVKKGEAISYILNINGVGNIEDIEDIKLDINDATIYENKPEIKAEFIDNEYKGTYKKSFSIVPNKSLVIPSIKLKYYDKKNQQVITKETKEFSIEVEDNNIINQNVKLEKNNTELVKEKEIIKIVEKSSTFDKILYFCLGIVLTLIIFGIYFYIINQKIKKEVYNTPLVKRVKLCKNNDELIKVLAVYINKDAILDELIFKLERKEDINILKKDILKVLKQLNL
jgi:hypothetical protein